MKHAGRCPVLNWFSLLLLVLNGAHVSHLTLRVGRHPGTCVSHKYKAFKLYYIYKKLIPIYNRLLYCKCDFFSYLNNRCF